MTMNEKLAELIAALESVDDDLWRLQNAAVQLTVEPSNGELAAQVAESLLRLARLAADVPAQDVALALERAAERLKVGSLDVEAAKTVLRLVDALLALRRGEGSQALDESVKGQPGPAPEQPMDVYDDLDTEDLRDYCIEAKDNLQTMETSLLEMERSRNLELVDEVFRGVHSIKGGAQYIGLAGTAALAHRLETLLDRLRAGTIEPTARVMGLLLRGVDALRVLIDGAARQEHPVISLGALIDEVTASSQVPAEPDEMLEPAPPESPPEATMSAAPEEGSEPPAEEPAEVSPPDTGATDESEPPAAGAPSDVEMFVKEYGEHMGSLKELLADMDALVADRERIATVRRDLHSIKGIAGFVGLPQMEVLAGALEVMLARMLRHRSDVPHDVRGIVVASMGLIEEIFEQFDTRQVVTSDPADLVRQIEALSEREARIMTWQFETDAAGPTAQADHPLVALFLELTRASEGGDAAAARKALASLEEVATLHGFDELAIEASHLASVYPELGVSERAEKLTRLSRLLPQALGVLSASDVPAAPPPAVEPSPPLVPAPGETEVTEAAEAADTSKALVAPEDQSLEKVRGVGAKLARKLAKHGLASIRAVRRAGMRGLLAVPGMSYQRAMEVLQRVGDGAAEAPSAAADPAPAADFELQIVGDDYDRELVEIYVDNTFRRVQAVLEHCDRGELVVASELLEDLDHAAGYMGYTLLREILDEVRRLLATGAEGVPRARSTLDSVRLGLQRTKARLAGLVGGAAGAAATDKPPAARSTAPVRKPAAPPTPPAQDEGARPATRDAARVPDPAAPPDPVQAPAARTATREEAEAALQPARPPAVATRETTPPALQPTGGDLAVGTAAEASAPALVDAQGTVVRVDTNKIDDLMNMVAELVVNRSSFMVLATTFRTTLTQLVESGALGKFEMRDLRNLLNRHEEATTDLGRVSNQLQEGVMKIRMIPLRTLFSRVPRLVRDLALREGREVRVSFSGEETELDKTVIEQLSDPIVHLIRNAVSHGIESPAERRAAGKPAEGTLRIAARHQGNMVIIDVEDDGRGIEVESVRQRLLQTGKVSAQDVTRLSQQEIMGALFLPGFSTASEVTDVSGRGVGLDVVKGRMESIGGSVEIFTAKGAYCRFAIRIPLTMAIMQALLVEATGEIFSIPVAAVIQAVKVNRADVSTVEGQEVITARNRVIPLVRIANVFSYTYHESTKQGGNGGPQPAVDDETIQVVVIQGEGREIGIVVDTLLGSQDIVIKGLEDELVDAPGVAGAAILGDGTVTLILDVAELQKMALDPELHSRKRFGAEIERFQRYLEEQSGGGPDLPAH